MKFRNLKKFHLNILIFLSSKNNSNILILQISKNTVQMYWIAKARKKYAQIFLHFKAWKIQLKSYNILITKNADEKLCHFEARKIQFKLFDISKIEKSYSKWILSMLENVNSCVLKSFEEFSSKIWDVWCSKNPNQIFWL